MKATASYLLMLQEYMNSKQKNLEIKYYALCLSNISKDFITDNMEKTGSKGAVNFFSVDFNPIDTNDILDIHKYLIKGTR